MWYKLNQNRYLKGILIVAILGLEANIPYRCYNYFHSAQKEPAGINYTPPKFGYYQISELEKTLGHPVSFHDLQAAAQWVYDTHKIILVSPHGYVDLRQDTDMTSLLVDKLNSKM